MFDIIAFIFILLSNSETYSEPAKDRHTNQILYEEMGSREDGSVCFVNDAGEIIKTGKYSDDGKLVYDKKPDL